jgi:hypothetical protein
VRCRRESKRCEFSATRRKRKLSESEDGVEGVLQRDKRMMVGEAMSGESNDAGSPYVKPDPASSSDNELTRPLPKWPDGPASNPNPNPNPTSTQPPPPPQPTVSQSHSSPGASNSSSQFQDGKNLRLPMYQVGERGAGTGAGYGLEGGQPMMNRTAVELLSPAISNSHDALHLLSEAAGRTEDLNRQSLENRYANRQPVSSFNTPMSPVTQAGTPRSVGGSFSRTPRSTAMPSSGYFPASASDSVDPRLPGARPQHGPQAGMQDPGYVDAVKAWSRLRFVRAGWLTVEESMAYTA